MRLLQIHPAVRAIVAELSKPVRQQMGQALRDVQEGRELRMPLSRPMPSVGRGVHELRIRCLGNIFRVFYVVSWPDAIGLIHIFQKKTQKTPKKEIRLAQKRLREMS